MIVQLMSVRYGCVACPFLDYRWSQLLYCRIYSEIIIHTMLPSDNKMFKNIKVRSHRDGPLRVKHTMYSVCIVYGVYKSDLYKHAGIPFINLSSLYLFIYLFIFCAADSPFKQYKSGGDFRLKLIIHAHRLT